MKALRLLLFALIFQGTLTAQSSVIKADSAYQVQNYSLAIQLYTQAIGNQNLSAELYFNLGNAYYRNNELGKSIWAYHKAKKINPQNEDINFNLNFASAQTKDKIEQNDTGILQWTTSLLYGRSLNFWAISAFIAMVISALFFYLYKRAQSKNNRVIYLVTSFSFVILFAICFCTAIIHKSHITNLRHGIVIDAVVKVRTAPSIENSVAFELHEGAKFTFKQTQGDWQRIKVGKNEGWILKNKALLY